MSIFWTLIVNTITEYLVNFIRTDLKKNVLFTVNTPKYKLVPLFKNVLRTSIIDSLSLTIKIPLCIS